VFIYVRIKKALEEISLEEIIIGLHGGLEHRKRNYEK
jgi:hypothetical protein